MASLNRRGMLALLVISQALLLQVQTLPLQAESLLSDKNQERIEQSIAKADCSSGKKGIASYYAKKYHGKRTTSGARYSPKALTAAHQSLPLGTKVKDCQSCQPERGTRDRQRSLSKKILSFHRSFASSGKKTGIFWKGNRTGLDYTCERRILANNSWANTQKRPGRLPGLFCY